MNSDRRHFIEELEATKEQFVRLKLMSGGYPNWQEQVAREWLSNKELARQDKRERMRTALAWFGVLIAAAGIVAAKYFG